MDVKTITLSAEQQKSFDKFKKSNSARLTKEEFMLLRKDKLLEPTMDGKSDWYSELPSVGECSKMFPCYGDRANFSFTLKSRFFLPARFSQLPFGLSLFDMRNQPSA